MRKRLLQMAGARALVLAGAAIGQSANRWSIFHQERVDYEHGVYFINALHDRDTGQELVCVSLYQDGVSCYLTGRVWK